MEQLLVSLSSRHNLCELKINWGGQTLLRWKALSKPTVLQVTWQQTSSTVKTPKMEMSENWQPFCKMILPSEIVECTLGLSSR